MKLVENCTKPSKGVFSNTFYYVYVLFRSNIPCIPSSLEISLLGTNGFKSLRVKIGLRLLVLLQKCHFRY